MKTGTFTTLIACMLSSGALTSCHESSDNDDQNIKRMLVEKYYDSPDIDKISSKVKVLNVFQPEFTENSMLTNPTILAINDNKAYVHDLYEGKWMTTYGYPDGKLIDEFNHYGPGPEEYMDYFFTYFTPDDGLWTIMDKNAGRYNLMQYDTEGNFVKKTENDSIFSLSPMKNGNWLAFNDFISFKGELKIVTEKKIYEYSGDWKLLNILDLKERRWEERSTQLIDRISFLDGHNYISDNDTVWEYMSESHTLKPVIAMEFGKYHFDWSSLKTFEEIKAAKENYPMPKHPVFNNGYAFDRYYIGNDSDIKRYDLYDLKTGDLVYRNTAKKTSENDTTIQAVGFPVNVEGKTLYGVFLDFVRDGHFFVLISNDELMRLYDTDDINPLIVEIEIQD